LRTQKYMTWIKEKVHFDQPAQEATLLDYVHEVEHMTERIQRLEKAITEAVQKVPPEMRAVIEALQALRGVAHITAVSVVAELGSLSRFQSSRQLMGYSGLVSSEFSSGNLILRSSITKTGNTHLRRVIIESAWAYQHRPWIGGFLLKRHRDLHLTPEVKEIAWKAQWRLHTRYKNWRRRARRNHKSSPPRVASCWASSGPSPCTRKRSSERPPNVACHSLWSRCRIAATPQGFPAARSARP